MKKIALFLFFVVLAVSVYAETMPCAGGYCFDCYDSSQNLPQNQVVTFSKDANGYMFVAGRNFLARFDGYEFYLPGGERLAGIPTSTINDFLIDDNGFGYVATDLGLWTADFNNFEGLSFKNIGEIGNSSVKSLAYDKHRALLFGAVSGKGVFALSAKGFFEWFSPENSCLATRNVEKVFADSLGTIWLGTENGVYFLKDGSEVFVQIDYLEDSVSAFAEGENNTIYAGGKGGYYTIKDGEVSMEFAGEKFSSSDITSLLTGDDGTLWVGTKNSGLFIVDDNGAVQIKGAITALTRDNEGEVWFGTSDEGFCIAKKSAFKDVMFGDESVSGVVADASGKVFVNTKKGIRILGKNEVIGNSVFDRIFFDKTDNLWASSKSFGLFIMQPDYTFKPVKEIFTSEDDLFPASSDVFFSDADGNVWVNDLSMPGAVFLFRNDRTAERFMLPDSDAEIVDIIRHRGKLFIITKRNGVFSLEANNTIAQVDFWQKDIFVKRVFVDSKQRVWIITLSDEIFIDIEGDAVAFPVAGIRGEAAIHSISEDKKGNLWIMTNAGVVSIKGADAACFVSGRCAGVPLVVYGKKDGMSSVECAEGRSSDAAVSADGLLFVPMMKGVAVFDTNYVKRDGFVPEITINRIFDDNGKNYKITDSDKVFLPASVNNLKIFYSAPLFSGTETLLFDYSFDREHVREMIGRMLVLSDVQSGLHEFSISAYRSDDPTNFSEKRLVFNVKPAFYEKKWFVITSPVLAILMIIVVIFLNRRIRKIRNAEIKRLIDEKTAELQMKNNSLKEAVMRDPLTGLMNRRYMFDVEERKIRRFIESRDRKMHLLDNRNLIEKNDFVYGVIMMDIDFFKRVNDIYGHDAGDMVLKGVSEIMQESVRADDILIRWGGEEFLIVLKNIPIQKILEVANKIRKSVEMHPFQVQGGTTVWITVSMGIVFLPFFSSDPKLMTFENIITIADIALYNSKEHGRDMATFVLPGDKVPETQEDISGMLTSSEFATVNGFYSFEKIEPDNFSEFEI